MTKRELIVELEKFGNDDVVICMNQEGMWDNIQYLNGDGSTIAIMFGGGSPFSDE